MDQFSAPLTLTERVRSAIDLGESHFREFKSALDGPPSRKQPRSLKATRRDIGEALVAFANADGGELLVGVEDGGTVTGVHHKETEIETLLEAWQTQVYKETPLSPPRVARLELDGRLVLYFSVEKGTSHVHLTSDGRCLQRRDRETVPVASEQIQFERQEQLSRGYDREFVDGADPSVLNLEAVEQIGDEIAPGLSVEKVLQLLDLAEFGGSAVRLRRAAVLLLAKEITHWHPRCEVRVLRVSGTKLLAGRDYNVVSDSHVVGSVLKLLTQAWEEVRPYLVETRLGPDGRFEEQVRYPEDACREALTNAIAHRDYSIEGRAIEVYVFDDRLEVRSPGALLSTVTIEGIRSLQGIHQSRNTTLARTLRELGYMREMGEGFQRIFQLMRDHDLIDPELRSDAQGFVVALKHRSIFSEDDQRWIAAYEHFDLQRDEEKVLLLGRGGAALSVNQIMETSTLVDTEDYRTLVQRLQRKGLIRGIEEWQRAKQRRSAQQTRSLPRWTVVQPKDAAKYLGELVSGAVATYQGVSFTNKEYAAIARFLGKNSPFSPNQGLHHSFSSLGLTDKSGRPTGRLRVLLDDQANKPLATQTMGTVSLPNSMESIEEVLPESRDDTVENRNQTRLFVGNLPFDCVKSDIQQLFASIAGVLEISLAEDYTRRGRNRGFAFVEMCDHDAALQARLVLDGEEIGGRAIRLDWSTSTHR